MSDTLELPTITPFPTGHPGKDAAARWEIRHQEFRIWAHNRCGNGGRFFLRDLGNLPGMGPHAATTLIKKGVAAGWLVPLGERGGFAVPGIGPRRVTLQDVVALAERSVDHNLSVGSVGRRKVTCGRRIVALTKSQFESARAAAGLLAWGLTGDKTRLADVGPEHFTWDEGAEEFTLVGRVAEWSDAKKGAVTVEERRANHAAREKHVSGARLLLDLAASMGLLGKAPVHEVEYALYAPEYQAWIDAWEAGLGPACNSKTGRRELRTGLTVWARLASRRNVVDPAQIPWALVVEDLEAQHQTEGSWVSERLYKMARRTYLRIELAGGLPKDAPRAQVSHATRLDGRLSLVSSAACWDGAVRGDFSLWMASAKGLVEGDYGLAGYAMWVNRNTTSTRLKELGLPEKARPNPSVGDRIWAAKVAKKGRKPWSRRDSVVANDLELVAQVAGWAVKRAQPSELGTHVRETFDPMQPDAVLALVLDTGLHERYFAQRGNEVNPVSGRSVSLAQTAATLSRLASPWCQARALQRGETELAEKLRTLSDDLMVRAKELEPHDDECTNALEKIAVWEADGVEAYTKLGRLADFYVEEIERYGGLLPQEQVAAIRACEFVPRNEALWATAVRRAALLTLLRRVPLRVKNVSELRIHRWKVKVNGESITLPANWRTNGVLKGELWEGSITLEFTAEEMKGTRPFTPPVIHADEVGDPAAEADLRRWLWELYLMPGGARDALLSLPGGAPVWSPLLFPALLRHVTKEWRDEHVPKGCPWSPVAISGDFRRGITRFASPLGLEIARLRAIMGCMSEHIVRHAFGTYFVRRGQIKLASLMLHHKSMTITEEIYTGLSESQISVDEMRRSAGERTDNSPRLVWASEPPSVAQQSPSSRAPSVVAISETHVCVDCFEHLRIMNGVVARRCHNCHTVQPHAKVA